MNKQRFFIKHKSFVVIILALLPVLTAFICLAIGRYPLPLRIICKTLFFKVTGTEPDKMALPIVFNLRLPRILLALGMGAGLACAGAAFQSLFANMLATPDTLGVTTGASVGAVIALIADQSMLTVQIVALVFGLATVLLTTVVAKVRGETSITRLVLSGVIISALLGAILSILKYAADPKDKLPTITYWLMGSLAGITYRSLLLGIPPIILGIIVIYLLRWRLNILSLSEDEAKATGTNVAKIRLALIIAATMITASSVSMCGQVGWVGLIIPHSARMLGGSDNRFVVPISISLGAIFMLGIDTVSRTLLESEIPISTLTALVGAPFFITLLRRTGGRWV